MTKIEKFALKHLPYFFPRVWAAIALLIVLPFILGFAGSFAGFSSALRIMGR